MRPLAGAGPSLNRLDLVLLLVLAVAALLGWRRGFVSVVLGYAGYLVALVLASRYAAPVGRALEEQFGLASRLGRSLAQGFGGDPGAAGPIASTLGERLLAGVAFMGLMLAFSLLLGWGSRLLGGMANAIPVVGTANRLLGAATSLAISGLFLTILLIMLSWLGLLPPQLWSSSRVAWALLRAYGGVATLLLGRMGPLAWSG